MIVRDCTLDDVPWLLREAKRVFAPQIAEYDEKGAALWVDHCVRSDGTITMRGPGVAGFADLMTFPWAPRVAECMLIHLFGQSAEWGESIRVVEAIRDRAKEIGCRRFYVGSAFRDLAVIGKRLGGKLMPACYELDLGNVQ